MLKLLATSVLPYKKPTEFELLVQLQETDN